MMMIVVMIDGMVTFLLECLVQYLVKHQCQKDGYRKPDQQRIEADDHGVSKRANKLIIAKQSVEMLKANPGAVRYTTEYRVILEGDLQAVHRLVEKHQQPHDGRQQHHVELPFTPQVLPDTLWSSE